MNGTIEPIPLKDVPEEKKILDVTCGSRSIWFNKENPAAIYCDKRNEELYGIWKDSKRTCIVNPDVICDFTSLPFKDNFNFSVKISIPLENTGVSSVFATSVWPFSLIFSLARRNEGNFFQAVPTTLSSSLAEVRLASLVAWA